MGKSGLRTGVRVTETEIDAVLARAFSRNLAFCDLFRSKLGLRGSGCATRVEPQAPHAEDPGTIDLDVNLPPARLLIENKIQATWSRTGDGVAQPERYTRSAKRFKARSVLIAPRAYVGHISGSRLFDHGVAYELLLPALEGEDRELLRRAAAEAVIPTENPSEAKTSFFAEFGALVAEIAPGLVMKKKGRNKGSYTAHFDGSKTLLRHPGLPIPSIFLQFREGNVKLIVRKWGWHLNDIVRHGGHHEYGLTLKRVGRVGTLGIVLPSPRIETKGDFEPQRDRAVEAIRATERICRWWDQNPEVLSAWARIASTNEA